MNYSEFKEHLAAFAWRDGDPDFLHRLDSMIVMAENRINRDVRVQEMTRVQTAVLESQNLVLPADYNSMRMITTTDLPSPLTYKTPHELEALRLRSTAFHPYYSIAGGVIRFVGPMSQQNPRQVVLTYYAKVPHFKDTDESFLATDYLDLYTYATLAHSAPYLRDDARVSLWKNEYNDIVSSVASVEQHRRYAGSPLEMRLPGVVA